ncbi:MAG: nucleotidyltransferase family protein, partial [Candidatus Tectomicrobia bacterium]|nr:nucleotidyltransferase family protein [Candidatus Tectomicrobia bacterium]
RFRALLQEELDWATIMEQAIAHGTLALLYQNLQNVDADTVPQAVMEQLRTYFHSIAEHNLRLTHELIKLLELFEAHDIQAIPYKGPAVAVALYGNILLRQYSDLDIIVAPERRDQAKALLYARGYELWTEMTDAQHAAHEHETHADTFVHPTSEVAVDLHWTLAQRRFAIALAPDHLWDRLEPVALPGKTVNSIPVAELLLILCVHGAKHGWERLGWLCDIAELIDGDHDLDWDRIMAQARDTNNERILLVGLCLARDLLGATLPHNIQVQIDSQTAVQSLAERLRTRILSETQRPLSLLKQQLLYPQMRERFMDKLPYFLHLIREALTPNTRDHEHLPLPPWLAFLHYPYRPFRLITTYGLGPIKRRLQ